MEKKLVEVSDTEVVIDFALNCKCRANVRLTSLTSAAAVAFKVQTSSPNKFLVNPPSGLIPPLSTITFQIILKPQSQLPPDYPRSPSDRFLIRAAEYDPDSASARPDESVGSWLSSQPVGRTQDLKLKVAFAGPILLRHAVACGDTGTVKKLIKRQSSILAGLSTEDVESLLRAAADSSNSVNMVKLLAESGLAGQMDAGAASRRHPAQMLQTLSAAERLEHGEAVLTAARRGDSKELKWLLNRGACPEFSDQNGLTALHVAAVKGHREVVELLLDGHGLDIEGRDSEGHVPLHLAVEGGSTDTVEALITAGADVNAATKSGATPLYIAKSLGYEDISRLLESRGAVYSSLPSSSSGLCD